MWSNDGWHDDFKKRVFFVLLGARFIHENDGEQKVKFYACSDNN